MKPPEIVNVTEEQIAEILALAKPAFPEPQYELLKKILDTFFYVMLSLQNVRISLKRFRKMLFGTSTESKRNLKGMDANTDKTSTSTDDTAPNEAMEKTEGMPPAKDERKVKPGHGRNGADKYHDSPVIKITIAGMQPGDYCPKCFTGKIYYSTPRTIVKVVGQPPLKSTIYQLEQYRCRSCDAIFSAPMPAGIINCKYDHSCATMIAMLRYGSGMPFNRLERLQANLNVPLSDATQWDIVSKAVATPSVVFDMLIYQAAQADILHCDDSPMKVLSLMEERKEIEAEGKNPKNKAINTSGIVAVLPEGRKVVLFFTGHQHAGQNIGDILALRNTMLAPPIQMSDALASNHVSEFSRLIALCLTHGRRRFVDVMEHFPKECHYVINTLGTVYANDAHCRNQKMSSDGRLLYHQAHSAKPMHELKLWMDEQFAQKKVEPNSELGKAIQYMINHWDGLTLFLHKSGAPLDNNLCEQALKRAIMHRKNSMFYKTIKGAQVGDIYMSIIHTCELCKVNTFDYLQALHSHANAVIANAALWLPWNYKEQLLVAT
jgi:hypothetical protein